MTIRSRAALVLCVLLVAARAEAQFKAADPAPGEQFHAEMGLLFWTPTPEILLSTGALAASGLGEVDFVKTFSIENKRFREFRVTLKPGRKHKIRFSSLPITYTQQATLTRTIQFGNLTVPVSTTATFDMKWDLRRYGYEWDVVAGDRGYLGLVAELKDNKVSATVTSPSFGTEATEQRAPIPTIGFSARAYPHKLFSITGEFTGFKVPDSFKDKFQGKFFDFDLYGTLSFGRNVAAQAGYRSVVVDYLHDTDAGNLKMKGMYWGGLVRF